MTSRLQRRAQARAERGSGPQDPRVPKGQAVMAALYQAAGPLLTRLYKQELAERRDLRDVVALVTCRAKFLSLIEQLPVDAAGKIRFGERWVGVGLPNRRQFIQQMRDAGDESSLAIAAAVSPDPPPGGTWALVVTDDGFGTNLVKFDIVPKRPLGSG